MDITSNASRALWPDYQIADYAEQLSMLATSNDTHEGTERLRACGETYLPRFPLEEPDDYKKRLGQSVLFNAYERAVGALVGMAMRKDPVLADDVPEAIQDDWENIDMEGTHGDVFLKEALTWAIVDGHSFIFVDAPPSVRNSIKGRTATYEDQLKSGNRPYWCIRRKGDVINWRIANVRGRRVLTQVTMREWVHQYIGSFGEDIFARYRVLKPGGYEVWEAVPPDSRLAKKGTLFRIVEQGETDLNYIPLFPVYTRRKQNRMMVSQPMLMAMVYENLLHYRLSADYHNILHYANVPILATINEVEDGVTALGAAVKLRLSQNGDAKWVEHAGTAIGAARTELLDTEARMGKLALAALAPKGDVEQTATEQLLDVAAESSQLAGAVRNLQDAAEGGLGASAEFRSLKLRRGRRRDGGSIRMNDEFVRMILDTAKLQTFQTMVEKRQLSLETLWTVMEKHGELPPDFDPEVEQERIMANIINFPAADTGPITVNSTSGNPAGQQPGKSKIRNKDVAPEGKAGQQRKAA